MKQYINAIVDRTRLLMLFRKDDGVYVEDYVAEYCAFYRAGDVTEEQARCMALHATVLAEDSWLRVTFRDRYKREERCKHWDALYSVKSYEADVSPVRRWLSDTGAEIAKPLSGYLDIETDSRVSFQNARDGLARVLCWALETPDGVMHHGLLAHDTDTDERRLLTEFWQVAEAVDQLVAWNGDGFDFEVLKARSKLLRVQSSDIRRWLFLDQMLCFKRNNIMSAESGDEKQSFSLEAIAQSILGEGKHALDASKSWQYWAAGGEQRAALLRYNVQDTRLLRKIEEKTGYIALFQTLCEVCRVFPDSRGLKPTQQVDGFMLRLGVEKNVHFATKWFGEETEQEQFRGAFVMEPQGSGIQKNVHVGDFASLYPAIMITWNLSPDTKLRIEPTEPSVVFDRSKECFSPSNGLVCDSTKEGILSTALQQLLALRAEWNKRRAALPPGTPEAKDAERRTNAYKTAANSFYGVMGTQFSRYYDREISESTTQNGVWLIKMTMAAAEDRGWKVVYGDTDSLFIQGCSAAEFGEFTEWCNAHLYPKLLAEQGCPTNRIKLAYEKEFERLVFTSAKRYFGRYAHYKGKAATAESKPEIKGLEYKRGDTNKTARMLQGDVIGLLNDQCEDPARYAQILDRYKDDTLVGDLPLERIVLSKSISRELEDYTAESQPHVRVAKMLLERGEDVSVGSRVRYVVTDASVSPMTVIPADDFAGECDRYYLWESLIFPPTMRLVRAAFPTFDWSKWECVRPSRTYNPNQLLLFG